MFFREQPSWAERVLQDPDEGRSPNKNQRRNKYLQNIWFRLKRLNFLWRIQPSFLVAREICAQILESGLKISGCDRRIPINR